MRRILITVLLVATPTVGLGIGWLSAVRREEAGYARERRAAVERTADAVVTAAGESLEALRELEDARPYDQYNYYWSPPDVLATQEAVVVSPLVHPPEDARIIGWFQVDPGGQVRSPSSHVDAPPEVRAHGEAVIAALRPESLAAARILAHGSVEQIEVAQVQARVVRSALPTNPVQSQGEWLSQVATEIRQAQAGSVVDLDNLNQRGRVARPARTERTWQDVQAENEGRLELNVLDVAAPGNALPATTGNAVPQAQVYTPTNRGTSSGRQTSEMPAFTTGRRPQRQVARTSSGSGPAPTTTSTSTSTSTTVPQARATRPRTKRVVVRRVVPAPPPTAGGGNAEVVYTPMSWGLLGEQLALYRVVSSEGASSVQGLLIDREELFERWLPALAEREAEAVAHVRIVGGQADPAAERCAVHRALPAPIENAGICLEPLAAASAAVDPMTLQVAALLGLVLLLGAGSVTLIVGERRAAGLAAMQREFVANVSHELRTPLTTLRMHAELLREGWVDDASRARFYDDLVVESTRLGQLVENVLTLSRLERGRGPKPEPGDLGACVTEAVEKRRRFVELRGFGVEVDAPPAQARFDREAVDAIVANLVDNAVKYGGGAERRVSVSVRTSGQDTVIAVTDRGPGIAVAERDRVFEPFYRAGSAQGPKTGTGLGLALVRRLAREQGGEAKVRPTEHGCTVEVRLPACV